MSHHLHQLLREPLIIYETEKWEDTLDQTLRLCIEGSSIYQMNISIQFEELETAETKTISNLNVLKC